MKFAGPRSLRQEIRGPDFLLRGADHWQWYVAFYEESRMKFAGSRSSGRKSGRLLRLRFPFRKTARPVPKMKS
jgi:hypothetical protein